MMLDDPQRSLRFEPSLTQFQRCMHGFVMDLSNIIGFDLIKPSLRALKVNAFGDKIE